MSEGNYRLKKEVIDDFMKQRMPTLCEAEKPLKWWLDNRIVPNDEDLELCEGKEPTSESKSEALALNGVKPCFLLQKESDMYYGAYEPVKLFKTEKEAVQYAIDNDIQKYTIDEVNF